MVLKIRFLICVLFSFLFSICVNAQGYKLKTIVIDPGHGGNKPGATSGIFSVEKNVALAISLKLNEKINAEMPDVNIILTRNKDIDVDLYRRAEIANKAKADLFISIHCNSAGPESSGTETLVAGSHRLNEQNAALRENEDIKLEKNYKKNYEDFDPNQSETFIILSLMKNVFRDKSLKIAKYIQNNFTNDNKRVNRGVKEQGVLVLQRCGMPAVLIEIGFISNPKEEEYMNSEKGQTEIVNAIFKAIKQYKKEIEN
ncbi:MAG: N-acetylmuramoyl-L-alanine amidase [Sphingobacteriaceae bacterium]|nr:N-acetylmuramoyl-L-alanine amidase [Sphingobacteriaceae bacterium]